jgi:hypothetical protein
MNDRQVMRIVATLTDQRLAEMEEQLVAALFALVGAELQLKAVTVASTTSCETVAAAQHAVRKTQTQLRRVSDLIAGGSRRTLAAADAYREVMHGKAELLVCADRLGHSHATMVGHAPNVAKLIEQARDGLLVIDTVGAAAIRR